MKKIILVFLLVFSVFSIDRITTPHTAAPGAPVSSSGTNANVTALRNGVNTIVDTLTDSVPRWNWFSNHEKTFSWMEIDTIKGPVRIDTVAGTTYADNLYTTGRDTSIQTMIDDRLLIDDISGTSGYLGIFTGTNSIGNSGILKNGSSYGFGSAFLNNDGTADVGLSFNTSNRLSYVQGEYNIVGTLFHGIDRSSEYFGTGVIDDEVNITAGSSGSDNVDMVIRTATAGSESEAMRLKYHGALQTNGNYINNDGTASEGLVFDASNDATFTEDLTVNGDITNTALGTMAEYTGVCTLVVFSGTLTGDSIGVVKVVQRGNAFTGNIYGLDATASVSNTNITIKLPSGIYDLITGASTGPGGDIVSMMGHTYTSGFFTDGVWNVVAPSFVACLISTATTEMDPALSFTWVH